MCPEKICNYFLLDRKETIFFLGKEKNKTKLRVAVLQKTPLGRKGGHAQRMERALENSGLGSSQQLRGNFIANSHFFFPVSKFFCFFSEKSDFIGY